MLGSTPLTAERLPLTGRLLTSSMAAPSGIGYMKRHAEPNTELSAHLLDATVYQSRSKCTPLLTTMIQYESGLYLSPDWYDGE